MTCRVVVGLVAGVPRVEVREAILRAAPEGSEIPAASADGPGVLVLRIPEDSASVELLADLRATDGVAYAEQERIYEGFGGLATASDDA